MADKTKLTQQSDVTASAGATGKTISTIKAYEHGNVVVVELNWSDSTTSYVKVRGFQVEVGGTNDFGSGKVILS